jgi:hypothetical protein
MTLLGVTWTDCHRTALVVCTYLISAQLNGLLHSCCMCMCVAAAARPQAAARSHVVEHACRAAAHFLEYAAREEEACAAVEALQPAVQQAGSSTRQQRKGLLDRFIKNFGAIRLYLNTVCALSLDVPYVRR